MKNKLHVLFPHEEYIEIVEMEKREKRTPFRYKHKLAEILLDRNNLICKLEREKRRSNRDPNLYRYIHYIYTRVDCLMQNANVQIMSKSSFVVYTLEFNCTFRHDQSK